MSETHLPHEYLLVNDDCMYFSEVISNCNVDQIKGAYREGSKILNFDLHWEAKFSSNDFKYRISEEFYRALLKKIPLYFHWDGNGLEFIVSTYTFLYMEIARIGNPVLEYQLHIPRKKYSLYEQINVVEKSDI